MRILALDLGSLTGVACGDAGAAPACETWRMPKGGGPDVGEFMAAFSAYLWRALDADVDLLVFEAPFLGPKMLSNMHTARRLIGLSVECERQAHNRGIAVAECHIGAVKRDFAGNGRAQKNDMLVAARRRGFNPANEHEADALGCFVYTVACKWPHLATAYDPIFAGRG